jgi:IS5 family transposase
VGIELGREPVPDATTLLKFRRLLNAHDLGEALFARVGQELQAQSIKINTGAIVDATIIRVLTNSRVRAVLSVRAIYDATCSALPEKIADSQAAEADDFVCVMICAP